MRWILALVMCLGVSWAAEPCPGQWGNPRAVGRSLPSGCSNPAHNHSGQRFKHVTTSPPGQQVINADPGYSSGAAATQAAHPAVCRISSQDRDGNSSGGQGTLVWKDSDYGVVMSCEHVFTDCTSPASILVTFPNGESFRSNLVTTDPTLELAAVVIKPPLRVVPMAISTAAVPVGVAAKIIRRADTVTSKILPSRTMWMKAQGTVVPGDSGGPIVGPQGRLLGVYWGGSEGTVSFASCRRVRTFLCDPRRKILPWIARGQPCPCGPSLPVDESPPVDEDPPSEDPPAPGCDLSDIKAELAELRVLIAAIPAGRDGKDGATGPQGEPGRDGEDGKDGVSPEIDYQEVADKVTPLLPPLDGITFIVQHSNGATETATAYLGDTVILWRDKAGEAGVSVTTP